jgi:demethylmenaquinone methyltransferase/2-methoxy-6-polyprenyl-1,4-benzoquinol methylase
MVGLALHRAYDALNTALFLPWGGSRRLRRRLVDALDVRAGQRVLELGCGTGQVTALLLERGADVTGVDALEAMLVGARRRAPEATLVVGDAMEAQPGRDFDRVVLSFVLHNADAAGRVALLRRAADLRRGDGRIGVLEWAQPAGHRRRRWWRRLLERLEPSPSVAEVLDGALDADVAAAGLAVDRREPAVGGRAQVLVLHRAA